MGRWWGCDRGVLNDYAELDNGRKSLQLRAVKHRVPLIFLVFGQDFVDWLKSFARSIALWADVGGAAPGCYVLSSYLRR